MYYLIFKIFHHCLTSNRPRRSNIGNKALTYFCTLGLEYKDFRNRMARSSSNIKALKSASSVLSLIIMGCTHKDDVTAAMQINVITYFKSNHFHLSR